MSTATRCGSSRASPRAASSPASPPTTNLPRPLATCLLVAGGVGWTRPRTTPGWRRASSASPPWSNLCDEADDPRIVVQVLVAPPPGVADSQQKSHHHPGDQLQLEMLLHWLRRREIRPVD